MTDNLAPCPLCGSTEKLSVYVKYFPADKREKSIVECTTPSCPMKIEGKTMEEVVEKWNRRPVENALRAKLQIAIDALEGISNSVVGLRDYPYNTSVTNDASEALFKIKKDKND
jgi:hypothetical protein